MEKVGAAIGIWLHLVATVAWLGGIFFMSRIAMPVLGQELRGPVLGRVMGRIRRSFLLWVWASIVVFIITGAMAMLGNPKYGTLVSFGSAAAVLILLKHIVVVAMIGLGVYQGYFAMPNLERLLSAMPAPPEASERGAPGGLPAGPPPALVAARCKVQNSAMALLVCGLVVLLLTAIAEVL